MHVFGLTGGIASGKSVVSERLRTLGVPVVDADLLAREVVEKGTPGLAAIVATFGADVLAEDGSLDRKKVAARVFHDETARAQLNGIVHPRITELSASKIARHVAAGEPLACYDAALLVETGKFEMFRPLVVVTAPLEAQIARSMARDGCTREAVTARIAAQMPLEKKVAVADFLVENDSDLASLARKVDITLGEVCARVGVDGARYLRRGDGS